MLGASAFAGRSSARPQTRFGEGCARRFPRQSRGARRPPAMVSRQPPSSARFVWPPLHRFTTGRTEQVPRRHSQGLCSLTAIDAWQDAAVSPARVERAVGCRPEVLWHDSQLWRRHTQPGRCQAVALSGADSKGHASWSDFLSSFACTSKRA